MEEERFVSSDRCDASLLEEEVDRFDSFDRCDLCDRTDEAVDRRELVDPTDGSSPISESQ